MKYIKVVMSLMVMALGMVSCSQEEVEELPGVSSEIEFSDEVLSGKVDMSEVMPPAKAMRGMKVSRDSFCVAIPVDGVCGDDAEEKQTRVVVSEGKNRSAVFTYAKKMPIFVIFMKNGKQERVLCDMDINTENGNWATFSCRVPKGFEYSTGTLKIAFVTRPETDSAGIKYNGAYANNWLGGKNHLVILNNRTMDYNNPNCNIPFYCDPTVVRKDGHARVGIKMLGSLVSLEVKSSLRISNPFPSADLRSDVFASEGNLKFDAVNDKVLFEPNLDNRGVENSMRYYYWNAPNVGGNTKFTDKGGDERGEYTKPAYVWAMPIKAGAGEIATALYLNGVEFDNYKTGAMAPKFLNRQAYVHRDFKKNKVFKEGKVYRFKINVDPTNGRDGKGGLVFSSYARWDPKGTNNIYTIANCTWKTIDLSDYYFVKLYKIGMKRKPTGKGYDDRITKFVLPLGTLDRNEDYEFTENALAVGQYKDNYPLLQGGGSFVLETQKVDQDKLVEKGNFPTMKWMIKYKNKDNYWRAEENPLVSMPLSVYYITKGGTEINPNVEDNNVVDCFGANFVKAYIEEKQREEIIIYPSFQGFGVITLFPRQKDKVFVMPSPLCDYNKWTSIKGGNDYDVIGKLPMPDLLGDTDLMNTIEELCHAGVKFWDKADAYVYNEFDPRAYNGNESQIPWSIILSDGVKERIY